MRKKATDAERKLWYYLRNRQMEGHKFRRQMVLDPYIVDFVCLDVKLIIELDGGQHASAQSYDGKRTALLTQMGYRVLRFWNHDVFTRTDDVLAKIRRYLL